MRIAAIAFVITSLLVFWQWELGTRTANQSGIVDPFQGSIQGNPDQPDSENQKVLILYDWDPEKNGARYGKLQAVQLRNLLGHFNLEVALLPVGNYQKGEIDAYRATFYLGKAYDHKVPDALIEDILSSQSTFVWFNYNLWQISGENAERFKDRFGFAYSAIRSGGSWTTVESPERAAGYDTVFYKGLPFRRVLPGSDVNEVSILNGKLAQVILKIKAGEAETPYAVRSGNFWFFVDSPLDWADPKSPYIIFCDLLHDILEIAHEGETQKALIRFEDVHPKVSAKSIWKLTDFLSSQKVPFSIGVIPIYRDPIGHYNDGVGEEISFSDWKAAPLRWSLYRARERGGTILMHGVTHQWGDTPNPENGVSGVDYEFWDAVRNQPLEGSTEELMRDRLLFGRDQLAQAGLSSEIFEVPHYLADPATYRAVASVFDRTYHRAAYFSSDAPVIEPLGKDVVGVQFFPFVIYSDYYGQFVIPENLDHLAYGKISESADDIVLNAKYATAVRDGYASFFIHPFLFDGDNEELALSELERVIDGIEALGYKWQSAEGVK